jgi:hypothetical protein
MRKLVGSIIKLLDTILQDCVRIQPPAIYLIEPHSHSLSSLREAIYKLEVAEFAEREKIVNLMTRIMTLFQLLNDEKMNRLKINSDEQKEKLLLNGEELLSREAIYRSEIIALHREATHTLFNLFKSIKEGWDVELPLQNNHVPGYANKNQLSKTHEDIMSRKRAKGRDAAVSMPIGEFTQQAEADTQQLLEKVKRHNISTDEATERANLFSFFEEKKKEITQKNAFDLCDTAMVSTTQAPAEQPKQQADERSWLNPTRLLW